MLNSFQRDAIRDLQEAGFHARARANWVEVMGGYRPEPIYTTQGVDSYIARNTPPAYEH